MTRRGPLNVPLRGHGTCPGCGKRIYGSRRDARRAGRVLHPSERLSPYECESEGGRGWHLGHLPPGVRAGVINRAALIPPRSR